MTGFVPDAGQPQASAAAASVGGAIGSAMGGMLSEQAIASTKGEVQKLVDSANSGGFAISEEGADEYIRVFTDFENVVSDLEFKLDAAKQSPALGGSPYATQVATHTQMMATGDAQSYDTALASLKEIVTQARQAFQEAKKRYAQMDDDAVQTFGKGQV